MIAPSRHRLVAGTLAASVLLHAAVLSGLPGLPSETPASDATVLQARLLPPPAVEAPAPAPPLRAAPKPGPTKVTKAAKAAKAATTPKRPAASAPTPQPSPPPVVAATDAVDGAVPLHAAPAADASAPEVQTPPAEAVAETSSPAMEAPAAQATIAAPADYPVRHVRLVYDLLHSESRTRVGNVVHTFRTEGERYEAEAVAEAVGFVSLVFRGRFVQRSRGSIGPAGLVPDEYTLDRGRGEPPERAVFDWDDGRIDLAWREERRTVALPPGAQDPLSVLYQLYFMQPLPLSSQVAVASSRKLGRYGYEVLGDADLQTPMGYVRALHVGRVEQDGSVLEVWLDRDRDLLPMRIYSRDRKGTILDQVVREVAVLEERPVARAQ